MHASAFVFVYNIRQMIFCHTIIIQIKTHEIYIVMILDVFNQNAFIVEVC